MPPPWPLMMKMLHSHSGDWISHPNPAPFCFRVRHPPHPFPGSCHRRLCSGACCVLCSLRGPSFLVCLFPVDFSAPKLVAVTLVRGEETAGIFPFDKTSACQPRPVSLCASVSCLRYLCAGIKIQFLCSPSPDLSFDSRGRLAIPNAWLIPVSTFH